MKRVFKVTWDNDKMTCEAKGWGHACQIASDLVKAGRIPRIIVDFITTELQPDDVS